MFPKGFFAVSFFAPTYFAPADGTVVPPSPPGVYQAFRGMMANLGRMMGP
jgi:hypothetical protein